MPLAGLIATMLTLNSAMAGGSIKDLDKKNGFRDVALTQRCDQIDGLKGNTTAVKQAVKDGLGADKKDQPFLGMLHYVRPSDSLEVGEAALLGVDYTCYAEQLLSVRLTAYGKRNAEPIRAALVEAFGESTAPDPDNGRWVWSGKKVILTFSHDPLTELVTVVYASRQMLDAKTNNDLALEQAAVNDL
ncbi:MAG TPA: hypothetical protein DFR83_20610 [Deltaproteobacteria bacterium]|nr:hypothetical protein [Deltaproteobacteria bacterium]